MKFMLTTINVDSTGVDTIIKAAAAAHVHVLSINFLSKHERHPVFVMMGTRSNLIGLHRGLGYKDECGWEWINRNQAKRMAPECVEFGPKPEDGRVTRGMKRIEKLPDGSLVELEQL